MEFIKTSISLSYKHKIEFEFPVSTIELFGNTILLLFFREKEYVDSQESMKT